MNPLAPPAPGGYRPDIDGLRAVAVLAVVAFHFFPAAFPGGFIGVDVFFVISGYLISRIILAEAQAGTFSVMTFYVRRVRRIFPALLVVLAASAAIGWRVLYFPEYRQLARHIAAGAGFVSNLLLWSEVGYFDTEAFAKPLLHLWSLGVEEQFYLAWPLLLAYACRTAGARRRMTLMLLAASFAAGLYATAVNPPAAFYLPVFRFWELMAGALLAQRDAQAPASPGRRDAMAWAGLALIVAGFAVIRPESAFPGWRALLPVVGTVLLVAAGPQALFNRHVLGLRGLVAIGLVSYPLYLWHWPLVTFLRLVSNDAPITPARGGLLFAFALLLAWATYALVERPVRTGARVRWKAAGLATAMLVMGGVGLELARENGVPERRVNANDPTFSARDGRNAQDVKPFLVADCRVPPEVAKLFRRCERDARGTERWGLAGDSKSEALFHGLVRTSTPQGRWLYMGGSTDHSSVLPVLSEQSHYASYREPSRAALDAMTHNPHIDTVVLVAAARAFFHLRSASSIDDLPESPFFEDARQGLAAYVDALVAGGKRVVLVADHPTLPDPKRCLADARTSTHGWIAKFFRIGQPDERCTVTVARHGELSAPYRRILEEAASRHPGRVFIFDTVPLVCDMARGVCGAWDGPDLMYSFADHVSDKTSTKIGRALNEYLATLDREPARAPRTAP